MRKVCTTKLRDQTSNWGVEFFRRWRPVANVHSDRVMVIDGTMNKVIDTLPAGRNPYALAVDPTADHIYAANFGEPSLTAIDVSQVSTAK